MKLFKNQNNTKWYRYLETRKHKLSISGMSVKFDWYFVVGIVFVIFIALMLISFNLFNSVEEDLQAMEANGNQASLSLKERDMRNTLDDLLDRRNIPAVKVVPVESSIPEEAATSTESEIDEE